MADGRPGEACLAADHTLAIFAAELILLLLLPTGERLGVAISPQLEEAFRALDSLASANQ